MRLKIGALLGVVALAGFASVGWMTNAQSGLTRLLSGTISSSELTATGFGDTRQAWQAPGNEQSEPSIALSEQDWLKLSGDVAPVSYLGPQAPAPKAPPVDQQPL